MTPSRLDKGTKLTKLDEPKWTLVAYPQCGEGAATLAGQRPAKDSSLRGLDPSEVAERRAAARAKGKVRRYCIANALDRMVTLTYRMPGCFDGPTVRRHMSRFVQELRRLLGGESFAYLWVPELHTMGHGYHVHMAVSMYVPKTILERAWNHGWVDIRWLCSQTPNALPTSRGQMGGIYLAKYMTKGVFHDGAGFGLHRYEVAEGFQPKWLRFTGATFDEVLDQMCDAMGIPRDWIELRSSWDWEDWEGPPARWIRWPAEFDGVLDVAYPRRGAQ